MIRGKSVQGFLIGRLGGLDPQESPSKSTWICDEPINLSRPRVSAAILDRQTWVIVFESHTSTLGPPRDPFIKDLWPRNMPVPTCTTARPASETLTKPQAFKSTTRKLWVKMLQASDFLDPSVALEQNAGHDLHLDLFATCVRQCGIGTCSMHVQSFVLSM